MLSYLLLFLAAVCNALMDTFIFRVDRSIFKHIGAEKLNPFLTNATHKKLLGTTIDPFHIVKACMIWLLAFAIALYKPLFGYWDAIILPFVWGIGFELFWSKILYKP